MLKLSFHKPGMKSSPCIVLDHSPASLGRAPGCDIRLPFATVSNHHLSFIKRGHHYLVADMGSKNGTYMDAHLLTPHHYVSIEQGTELRIADLRLRVETPSTLPEKPVDIAHTQTIMRQILAPCNSSTNNDASMFPFFKMDEDSDSRAKFYLNLVDNSKVVALATDESTPFEIVDAGERHSPVIALQDDALVIVPAALEGHPIELNDQPLTEHHQLIPGDRLKVLGLVWTYYDPLHEYLLELDSLDEENQVQRCENETREADAQREVEPPPDNASTERVTPRQWSVVERCLLGFGLITFVFGIALTLYWILAN